MPLCAGSSGLARSEMHFRLRCYRTPDPDASVPGTVAWLFGQFFASERF